MAKRGAVKDEKLSLEHRTTYRFSILHGMNVRALAGSFAKRFALNFSAWRTLTVIGRFEPVFPGRVGEHMTLGSDRVARSVDELVKKGLVARRQDAEDRRRTVLTLTPAGQRVYRIIDRERRIAEQNFLSVLTANEKRVFRVCLDKLEAHARRLYTRKARAED